MPSTTSHNEPTLKRDIVTALSGESLHAPPRSETALIGRCLGCERSLSWPVPKPGRWAAPVACPQCHRWYYTDARNDVTPVLRPDGLGSADRLAAQYSPQELGPLQGSGGFQERRSTARREVNELLPAVPLNAALEVRSETLEVGLVNLSPTGCCLQVNETLSVAYLLLDFGAIGFPGSQALASVRWLQVEQGVVRVGCEFMFGPSGDLPFQED